MHYLFSMLHFCLHWSKKLRVAPEIELTADQESELMRLARSKFTSFRLAQQAQIVLLATHGLLNKEIAQQLCLGRVQVSR
jgi:DNA-binding NarL/FixJ family response regulator